LPLPKQAFRYLRCCGHPAAQESEAGEPDHPDVAHACEGLLPQARATAPEALPKGDDEEAAVNASDAFELGAQYLDKKDLQNALVAFSQAIRIDPKFAQAYNGRAVTYALLEQPERALADCCEAIRLDPEDAEFYRTRGYLYESVGDEKNAQADLAKAEELDAASGAG
jgi:Tfp pilus assembly protein PilF